MSRSQFEEMDRELLYGKASPYSRMSDDSYNQLMSDMVATFSTAHGRRIFWHLLLLGHYADPVFSHKNPTMTRQVVERDFVQEHLFMVMSDAGPALLADILTTGLHEHSQAAKKED